MDSKTVIYFYVTQLEMAKIAFQKRSAITFTCFFFFIIAQPNIKILLWNLVYVLSVCRFPTYILFFYNSKSLVLISIYFWKSKFWVLGSKSKKTTYPDCKAPNFRSFGVYGLCFTSNLHILEACKHLPLFDPKSRSMTSLKLHFLTNFSTDFSEILSEDVKLMPNTIMQISRRYLLFLSYRENTGGGNISTPSSPALRGLTADISKPRIKSLTFVDLCSL